MKLTQKITESDDRQIPWMQPTVLEAWPGLDFSTPWINQWLLFKPVCWICSQAKCCWLTYHFSQLSLSVTYSSKLSMIKPLPLSSAFSLTQVPLLHAIMSWYSFFLSQCGILHSCLIGLAWVIGLIWVFPLIIMMMLMVIYILRSNHVRRRRWWHPTPVLLPGKSQGWRSLVGCSPWGHEESDTTEWLHFHALEQEMSTHSSVLAWRIPGTGESGGVPSMGLHRVGHDWSDLAAAAATMCQALL